jgi:hypothetical protein
MRSPAAGSAAQGVLPHCPADGAPAFLGCETFRAFGAARGTVPTSPAHRRCKMSTITRAKNLSISPTHVALSILTGIPAG